MTGTTIFFDGALAHVGQCGRWSSWFWASVPVLKGINYHLFFILGTQRAQHQWILLSPGWMMLHAVGLKTNGMTDITWFSCMLLLLFLLEDASGPHPTNSLSLGSQLVAQHKREVFAVFVSLDGAWPWMQMWGSRCSNRSFWWVDLINPEPKPVSVKQIVLDLCSHEIHCVGVASAFRSKTSFHLGWSTKAKTGKMTAWMKIMGSTRSVACLLAIHTSRNPDTVPINLQYPNLPIIGYA